MSTPPVSPSRKHPLTGLNEVFPPNIQRTASAAAASLRLTTAAASEQSFLSSFIPDLSAFLKNFPLRRLSALRLSLQPAWD